MVFPRRRTSTIGCLTLDGFVSGTSVEGSFTKATFLHWLEHSLVRALTLSSFTIADSLQLPQCSPYPGPLSVLVLDNAKIHQGLELLELADRFGVRIEFLPPYSPDLNPIEEAFSKIKYFLRRHQDYYGATRGDGILFDMYEVLDIITSSDAEGYFAHAGYF